MVYVGLDVHKKTIQAAAVDSEGKLLFNKKIPNTHKDVAKLVKELPADTQYVIESSSVWYGLFCFMRDDLHLNIVLSNPFNTKIIATSLKKTDKVDAYQLAMMLRGGYIAVCHVPSKQIVDYRMLTRARQKLVQATTRHKNSIHGILLQNGIKTKHRGFSKMHKRELYKLGEYRIDINLRMIERLDEEVAELNLMIRAIVVSSPDILRLTTIPGIGNYTALVIYAEVGDDINRFSTPEKLCAYAGIVPSVRNSSETVHLGRITKRGSRMLRSAVVEAALSHVIHAPDSELTEFYKRLAKKRGSSKAKVAAGSKLLRIIHVMMSRKEDYRPGGRNVRA